MATRRGLPLIVGAALGVGVFVAANVAVAAQAPVGLGTAGSFAVLAGSTVTNTGPTVINGDLGVHPGNTAPGFPPGMVNGTIHLGDPVAMQAKSDLTTAYNDAAGRTPFTSVAAPLGGATLLPGVYRSATFQITGTLTLDAQGDPNAVFIFQAGSTLITAPNSRVALINGAQACNVFWQVGSSATLDVSTTFVGTILALISITANTGATVQGRLLARTGATTLQTNTITRSLCAPGTIGGPTIPTTGPTGPGGVSVAIPAGSFPGGSIPGLNRGPTGDQGGPIPGDTQRSAQQREQDNAPATPAPAPPPAPPAPPAYGVGSSFLAPTPSAPPSRSQGPPSLAHTGSQTSTELGLAGVAFLIGGALLFFGQPLRRASARS